ncbi:MAG TPA: hypothetical protein PLO11_20570, partial [Escherichia coli]|nr:hypothetical protein [Escherichia coli]
MSIVKEEHKATLRKWHEELQEKRGERASLRRSTTVNDVCLTDDILHNLGVITDNLQPRVPDRCITLK